MELGFLFWLFFGGIIVASLQDLKRREVDNWLNLFLGVFGFIFIFYKAFFEKDVSILIQAGFSFVVMFVVMNMFYYGRVFAGGDAKLLLAMSVLFIGVTFNSTLSNIGIFLLFLMISGSVYGLVYSLVLYFRDMKKVNKEIKLEFKEVKWVKYGILGSFILIVAGGIIKLFISEFGFIVMLIGSLLLVFPFLFVFSKALEKISMIRIISGKELREGDWLVDDVKVKGKTIKANWEGLTRDDIKLLKSKKKITIKEGLPFVPAFLIAFLIYSFGKNWFLGLLFNLA